MKKYHLKREIIFKIVLGTIFYVVLLLLAAVMIYNKDLDKEYTLIIVIFGGVAFSFCLYSIIILLGYLDITEKKIALRSGFNKKVICWEAISRVDVLKIITPSKKNGTAKIRELIRIVSKLEGHYIAINFEFKDTDKAIHCILEECKRRGNIEIDPKVYELLERMS